MPADTPASSSNHVRNAAGASAAPLAALDGRRLLVVTKFRYMGDTIVATPFLRALATAAPAARVSVLAGPSIPNLLLGCPYVERVLPFEPKGSGSLGRYRAIIRRLREERFDAALLLNRSLSSALIVRAAGIPARIGHATEHRAPLLTVRVPYDWDRPDRDCALDLLRALGWRGEAGMPELWVSPDERAAAVDHLSAIGVSPGTPLIAVQAAANDPDVREWPAERFAVAADTLAAEIGARVLLMGSPEERAVAERVAATMATQPVIAAGQTDLRRALALLTLARVWIGNDGGMLHAAVALCPATVGIFGPTKAPRWSYHTPRHRTAVAPMPSGAPSEKQGIRAALDAITIETVCHEARAALAAT